MYTYQDFLERTQSDDLKMEFVLSAITNYRADDLYKTARLGDEYDRHRNRTIVEFQKLLYTVTGKAIPDNFSANYKLASGFFGRFTSQQNQYLLGNGVTWSEDSTAEKLGKDFDTQLQKAGKKALVCGVSYGFFNLDHLEIFSALEFVPLYDEENGALMAGIRFWQLSPLKPLRATLYELDGYTEYIWRDGEGEILKPKRAYKVAYKKSEADGVEIYDQSNYDGFPIVPLWGNPNHQSEIVGLREQIDCYDLIKSGFANTVDEASYVYWAIQNGGGMDDVDLAQFVERMKTVHAAIVDGEGASAQAHNIEAPYASREALLDRLRRDMYDDYRALDMRDLASGAATATQIRASYEPMDNKADEYEYCVIEFIQGILKLAGIEDDPVFTRSAVINKQEEIQNLLTAATYLDAEYVTRKVLDVFGDGDLADAVLERKEAENAERMAAMMGAATGEPEEEEEGEEEEEPVNE